jgi:hypothetical protein
MRMARRRVSDVPPPSPSLQSKSAVADFDRFIEWPTPPAPTPDPCPQEGGEQKARIFGPLRILHLPVTGTSGRPPLRHLVELDRQLTAHIFMILDLTIQALKTFDRNDLLASTRSP